MAPKLRMYRLSIRDRSVRAAVAVAVCVGALTLTAAAFAGSRSASVGGAFVKGSLGLGAVRTAPPFALTGAQKIGAREQLPGARVAAITSVTRRAMTEVPAAPKPKAKPVAKRTTPVTSRKPAAQRKAAVPVGQWQTAKVTWYGPGFYGHTMAGGGKLTPTSMVVAHRTMPFGTKIQFSYKGRTCVAVVQDRGPGSRALEFDLGPGTAQALGFSGVGFVQWRIVK